MASTGSARPDGHRGRSSGSGKGRGPLPGVGTSGLASVHGSLRIAESAVALGERGFALRGRAVTAGARRAHQHEVTALEDVLAAVVDRDPGDLGASAPAGPTAREARRRAIR